MKDREINLMDLMVRILMGWRVIVIAMLIGGILLGGLSYVNSYQTQKEELAMDMAVQERIRREGEKYLPEWQLYNIYTVLEKEREAYDQELYLQESVKMQIDALNVPRAELTYRVQAEDLTDAYQIEQIYEKSILGGLSKWLVEEGQEDISGAALGELIELGTDAQDAAVMGERDSFSVVIYHISEEQCLDLAERVKEYIQEQSTQLEKELGNHKVQLVSQNFSFVVDLELMDFQQLIRNSILELRYDSAVAKVGFSLEQRQYYNYMTNDEASVEQQSDGGEPENEIMVRPSISPAYVLLGMLIMLFVYVVYILLKYLLNMKVQITDDINAIYGVHELGVIPAADNKKKIFAFVDDWILKLCERNKRQFSTEKAIALAAAAVNITAQKEGLREVCCVGCDLQKDASAIADAIENDLKREGISMQVINDILYNQESMERILLAKGAFLLEKAGRTLYDEIGRELELLQRQDIKVLGVIVME